MRDSVGSRYISPLAVYALTRETGRVWASGFLKLTFLSGGSDTRCFLFFSELTVIITSLPKYPQTYLRDLCFQVGYIMVHKYGKYR